MSGHLCAQLDLVGQSVAKSAQSVLDELVQGASGKLGQVLLEVGASRLRASADGHRLALVVVGRRTCLIEMRTDVIVAGDEQTNAKWSTSISLRWYL